METRLPLKLTPEQVHQLQMEGSESVVLMDLRDFEDFQRQSISGSEWYPISQIEQLLKKEVGERLLVLICRYEMSVEALLRRNNIKHAVVLAGGILAWIEKGFPTICLQEDQLNTKLMKDSE